MEMSDGEHPLGRCLVPAEEEGVSTDKKAEGPPKVFVSYSWDSENHKNWVLDLCTKLRTAGVDVRLDQWHLQLGESITRFMERSIEESDRVLVVLTPNYAKKANNRQGGVGYEQQIISAEVFDGASQKFIPVLRHGSFHPGPDLAVPAFLRGILGVDMRPVADYDSSYDQLLRSLLRRTAALPPVGVSETESGGRPIALVGGIRLDDRLQPVGGLPELELACEDIFSLPLGSQEVSVPVFVRNYSPLRRRHLYLNSLKRPSPEESASTMELESRLSRMNPWGAPLDLILEEVVSVIRNNYAPGSNAWVYSNGDVAQVLLSCFHEFAKSPIVPDGMTSIDVYRPETSQHFRLHLDNDELQHVLESTGLETGNLIVGFGFENLPTAVLRSKIIPGMVFEFLRIKHMSGRAPDESTWFTDEGWVLGLA